ncbi:50S ribosomal protein L22 [candidate division WOR-3 bacterium JGI_Cruoil_03_51_56]|uniref:Large ribosomal subunit protein uL22 n=1 Tax=candidate division WOR-3 bacterium JGI_Cruoil_03_51_56 TaxID=1973747 RepID=A0A235BVF0_UNCW3|nr:MAG: 50S ribosomal protein L22 [candidate division WOR-3 bacterium JGI_Cruoil_03_51_56]
MEAYATTRYQRGSAKKMGLIVDLIRGKDVPTALRALVFLPKATKGPVLKTLRSAVANAINKAGKAKLHEEDLIVKEARADQGPVLKRWRPGPRGMASVIRKRTVHVHVRVATKKGVEL